MTIEKCHHCVGSQACENQVKNECLPVGVFGNLFGKSIEVATIGLNPALNEFYLSDYKTLKKRSQRLAALVDYNKASRAGLQEADVEDAKKRRGDYFINAEREPHSYFEKLESLISRIEPRWSFVTGRVVHIDLVACATRLRWGKLSDGCKKELIANCRGHFLETLSKLPSETLLLLDGIRVVNEMGLPEIQKHVLKFSQMKEEKISLIQGNRGFIGEIKYGDKKFPVRGWSMPVGQLPLLWRYDLAAWICGSMPPPWPFLPVSK